MTSIWPEEAQSIALVSFDVDPSPWLQDFIPDVAVYRILDLLDKYQVPATFFWTGQMAERNPTVVQECVRRGHEIGHHGWDHEAFTEFTFEESEILVVRGIEGIRSATDYPVFGFRSPGGTFSDYTFPLLHDIGIRYDTTLAQDEIPYWFAADADSIKHILEIPFHWGLDDAMQAGPFPPANGYSRVPGHPSYVRDVWISEFDACHKLGVIWNLAMHPTWIGRASRTQLLEDTIKHVSNTPGALFMRHGDLAKWWIDRHPAPPAGTKNPTAYPGTIGYRIS